MAAGKASDFKVYQPQFNGGFVEKQQQNIDLLQGKSMGAVLLESDFLKGDYRQESFTKKVSGLVTRRDTTSIASATDLKLTEDENIQVKLARKIGPVAQTLDAWRKIGADPEQLSFRVGAQAADDTLAEKLNTAIAAYVAAISNVADLQYDGSGDSTTTMTHDKLIKGLFKFGDKQGDIIAWVMHSKQVADLMVNAAAANVFQVAGVVINDGVVGSINRPIIMTDSSALVISGTTTKYWALGLTLGAIELHDSEVPEIMSETQLGLENIIGRLQGEYSYNLGIKGFKWDITNGGPNPDPTAIATASNWDQVYTSNKQLAGVMIKTA